MIAEDEEIEGALLPSWGPGLAAALRGQDLCGVPLLLAFHILQAIAEHSPEVNDKTPSRVYRKRLPIYQLQRNDKLLHNRRLECPQEILLPPPLTHSILPVISFPANRCESSFVKVGQRVTFQCLARERGHFIVAEDDQAANQKPEFVFATRMKTRVFARACIYVILTLFLQDINAGEQNATQYSRTTTISSGQRHQPCAIRLRIPSLSTEAIILQNGFPPPRPLLLIGRVVRREMAESSRHASFLFVKQGGEEG
uniref:Uncharacterized protein n=1 Tax=Timema poppense TaxID=170557 RepID=A0A7R9H3N0_TIMPO|nr:unnamed protein product [Timema poppensis]